MSFVLYCVLFGIFVSFPETECRSLTWNEPPPTKVVQAVNPVQHFSSRRLQEESINASLSWQFDFTDLKFTSSVIALGTTIIAGVDSSGPGPQPGFGNQYGIDWIPNQNLVRLIIFRVTFEHNGTFTCKVTAAPVKGFGAFQFESIVQVDVVAPPSNMTISRDLNVTAPANWTLNCSADGEPKPTITWTRLSDNTIVTMPLNIIGEKDKGSYRCTADNVVGKPLSKDVFVNVLVPPLVTLNASKVFVGREQTAFLFCEVEGNPTPIISWSPCDGKRVLCEEQYLNISKVRTARANYTCTATNALGVDSATTLLLIGGKNVYLRLSVSGECDNKDYVWETLQKELGKVFTNTQGYSGAEMIDLRCGSVMLDVALKFRIKVAEDETISIIQSAIVDGKLGELSVNVSYIIGIATPTSSTPKSGGLFLVVTGSEIINGSKGCHWVT